MKPLNKSIQDLPEGGKTKTKFPFPAQRQRPADVAFGDTSLCRKQGLNNQTLLMEEGDSIESHHAGSYGLSFEQVPNRVLKVVKKLQASGHQAYLVGGCIRDLILQRRPKDFDVATNLRPPQIRKLFRNCRLIGRRFRLAHVYFGPHIVEVATFRASPGKDGCGKTASRTGLLVRDNQYGTLKDDVVRRDFTVNALYYDPFQERLLAYRNATHDLHNRNLRTIGNSRLRYREDPVRMLRAVRFSAALHLKMAQDVARPIPEMACLLNQVPPARLFDEFVKLFHGGHAVSVFHLLRKHRLFGVLFPLTEKSLNDRLGGACRLKFLQHLLSSADERVARGDPVIPAFVMAGFLWLPMLAHCERKDWNGRTAHWRRASDFVFARQARCTALPAKMAHVIKKIILLQNEFKNYHDGPSRRRLISERYFRAAYDFMCLRALAGFEDEAVRKHWSAIQRTAARKNRPIRNTKSLLHD